MAARKRTAKRKSASRTDWLEAALEYLDATSATDLNIDRIAARLGVTKGSFYWHFADKADYVRAVAQHWRVGYTTVIRDNLEARPIPPAERLRFLARAIDSDQLSRYEAVLHNWARRDADVGAVLRRTFEERQAFVEAQFAALGFKGAELEARTRLFVIYFCFEGMLNQVTGRPASRDARDLIAGLLAAPGSKAKRRGA